MTANPEILTDAVTLYLGNCATQLKLMRSCWFHTVITSPPYYGLRDYGTANYEGGDPNHSHDRVLPRNGRGGSGSPGKQTANAFPSDLPAKVCSCGAKLVDEQIGLEETPEAFVDKLVEVFREVRRVLRDDGTLWLNIGDSYANDPCSKGDAGPRLEGRSNVKSPGKKWRGAKLKKKDLIGIPWMLAFALRADGWTLRQDIIWHKPSPMPESVQDRCTKAHEYIFLFTKSSNYFYDIDSVREQPKSEDPRVKRNSSDIYLPDGMRSRNLETFGLTSGKVNQPCSHPGGSNKRSVWTVASQPFNEAHFATFPPKLIQPMVKAGSSQKGCCATCGAPWSRVTEKTKLKRNRPNDLTKRSREEGTGNACGNTVAGVEVKTIGWSPSCSCEAGEAIPCRVLDPFNGAGTTGLVSTLLGRHYTGVELNPEYMQITRKRLLEVSGVAPGTLFAELPSDEADEETASLFDSVT